MVLAVLFPATGTPALATDNRVITFHTANADGILTEDDVSAQIKSAVLKTGETFLALFDASVTEIGEYAFLTPGAYNRDDLISVIIPDNVTAIGKSAFYNCTSLTSVVIGNGVKTIGDGAFSSCETLKNIVIGNRVESIHSYAFSGCTSLTSVIIPDSVTSIYDEVFNYCTGLLEINVNTGNNDYSSLDGVLFNKNRTLLHTYPLGRVGSYTIPDSVTIIGNNAFEYCMGLTSVVIPNSVKQLGNWVFVNCPSLTSVVIPNSVVQLGDWVFGRCLGLTSVTIPVSVESIGNGPFNSCSNLTQIVVASDSKNYSSE